VAPIIGNHEQSGNGYFDYFNGRGIADGVAGTRGKGWYSLSTGSAPNVGWQILALNSECALLGCEAEQLEWLRAQLAASQKPCTLAYWHRPRFSSGAHGDDRDMTPRWTEIANHGVDVALNGHEHDYERLAPLDAGGASSPNSGVRQFVVGTGGKESRTVGSGPHTEASNTDTFGYLELTLELGSYDWRLIRTDSPNNGTFQDSGAASCHA